MSLAPGAKLGPYEIVAPLGTFVRAEFSVLPMTITRVDLATGARTPVATFTPPDPAGHVLTLGVFVTPDAGTFVYGYAKKLTELYLVEGLR